MSTPVAIILITTIALLFLQASETLAELIKGGCMMIIMIAVALLVFFILFTI